jgi:hypothetical protein
MFVLVDQLRIWGFKPLTFQSTHAWTWGVLVNVELRRRPCWLNLEMLYEAGPPTCIWDVGFRDIKLEGPHFRTPNDIVSVYFSFVFETF